MNLNARSIWRALPVCAIVLTMLALFAVPQPGRADVASGDPIACGSTPFGSLCSEIFFTAVAHSPGTALISPFSSPVFPPVVPVTNIEASVGLTSPQVGSAFSDVTFLGESAGLIAADVSIPNAYWLRTGVWCWPTCATAVGALAIFNSIGGPPFPRGVYADAMVVLDPPGVTPLEAATYLDKIMGGNGVLANMGSLPIDAAGDVTAPALPGFSEAPEPSYVAVEMLAAIWMVIAVYQRRRRARPVTEGAARK
jgi:hypothetical protein